jgi:hypothetical protein
LQLDELKKKDIVAGQVNDKHASDGNSEKCQSGVGTFADNNLSNFVFGSVSGKFQVFCNFLGNSNTAI